MNAELSVLKSDLRSNRIKKIIRLVRFLISASVIWIGLFFVLLLADLVGWHLLPTAGRFTVSPTLSFATPVSLPALAWALIVTRVGLFMAGALILFWLLDLFEEGKFFSADNVSCCKRLGWIVLADWAVKRLYDSAHLTLAPELDELIPGLLIVLIAWITDEGRKMKEEQELTV